MSIKKYLLFVVVGAFFIPTVSDGAFLACPVSVGKNTCREASQKNLTNRPVPALVNETKEEDTEDNKTTAEQIALLTEQVSLLMAIVAQLQKQLENM